MVVKQGLAHATALAGQPQQSPVVVKQELLVVDFVTVKPELVQEHALVIIEQAQMSAFVIIERRKKLAVARAAHLLAIAQAEHTILMTVHVSREAVIVRQEPPRLAVRVMTVLEHVTASLEQQILLRVIAMWILTVTASQGQGHPHVIAT